MKRFHVLPFAVAVLSLSALTSCSNDDEYNSEIPRFSDVEIVSLDGSQNISVGKAFVVTPTESKSGKLLDRTKYQWTSTPEGITHKYATTVVYGTKGSSPSDTIVATTPGTYTLSFRGEYQVSGLNLNYDESQETPSGAKITYKTLSWQKYEVTITKDIVVD